MKAILLFFSTLIVIACSKNQTPAMVDDMLPVLDTTASKIIYAGEFTDGPFGRTMGNVSIVDSSGVLSLRIENFMVTTGPDLKVYLSKEIQPLNFLRLGNLKGLSGDQLYSITNSPDFMDYKYVLVHCEKYNHLFGSALLLKK